MAELSGSLKLTFRHSELEEMVRAAARTKQGINIGGEMKVEFIVGVAANGGSPVVSAICRTTVGRPQSTPPVIPQGSL